MRNSTLPLSSCVLLMGPHKASLCLSLLLCEMVTKKKQKAVGQRREGAQAGDHVARASGMLGSSSGSGTQGVGVSAEVTGDGWQSGMGLECHNKGSGICCESSWA